MLSYNYGLREELQYVYCETGKNSFHDIFECAALHQRILTLIQSTTSPTSHAIEPNEKYSQPSGRGIRKLIKPDL